jgi:hypothetical protein
MQRRLEIRPESRELAKPLELVCSDERLLLLELREAYCGETTLMGYASVWIGDSVFDMELACN